MPRSWRSSSPRADTTWCRSVAPYHSLRPGRATPRVRTPRTSSPATGLTAVAHAVLVASDTFFLANAGRVAELALAQRLPVFSTWRVLAEAGILASYGADLDVVARRSAAYVQRILNGAKPGDLPVEQPMKFELVINSRTAKALGMAISPAVLARADEVIR